MTNYLFMVIYMDEHGQNFLVKDDLSEQVANDLMATLDHSHKSYSILEYTPDMKSAMMFKHGVIIESETCEGIY